MQCLSFMKETVQSIIENYIVYLVVIDNGSYLAGHNPVNMVLIKAALEFICE